MSFSIFPCDAKDVPMLARIAGRAFETDRHTQMKALGKTPYDHEGGMQEALTSWVEPSDRRLLVNAKDDTTGEILGWVCWGLRGYDTSSSAAAPAPVEEAQKTSEEGSQQPQKEGSHGVEEPSQEPVHDDDPIARLEALTDTDMQRWMGKLMPSGTKCMFIISIAVVPSAQSRGVGSALIKYGTERADADGVFCWVHSSEAGSGAFEKQDFREVGRLTVDLDEYAPCSPLESDSRGGKWGEYVFRYMKRLPQRKGVTSHVT